MGNEVLAPGWIRAIRDFGFAESGLERHSQYAGHANRTVSELWVFIEPLVQGCGVRNKRLFGRFATTLERICRFPAKRQSRARHAKGH